MNPLAELARAEATGDVPEGADVSLLTADPVRWRSALLANIEDLNSRSAQLNAEEARYRSEWEPDNRKFHKTIASFLDDRARLVDLKAKIDTRLREVKLLLTPDQRDSEFRAVGAEKNRWRRLAVWLLSELDDTDGITDDAPSELQVELAEALTLVADWATRRSA